MTKIVDFFKQLFNSGKNNDDVHAKEVLSELQAENK